MAEEPKKDEKETKEAEGAAEETPEQEAKKRKKKLLLIAILGGLLVAGGGAGAFFFLAGGKKASTEHEEEISQSTVAEGHAAEDAAHKTETKAAAKDAEKSEAAKGDDKAAHDANGKEAGHAPSAGEAGDAAKSSGSAEKKGGEEIDFGETYKLQSFNLNLGNALENRYIRIEISLEYRGGEPQKQEIEKRMPQLRDAIIGIVQRKTREFLLSPDGKEALRKELLTRINRYMKARIEAVYITDLLIE